MSRLVHFTAGAASSVARAVSGAPRATLAVVLVVTLALSSVLPQLALVNSEDMWIPEGPRADAYHGLAQAFGSTEYVGVLARPSSGNIVSASSFEALLALEDAAVHDSSVAEAFRFPRDPDANAVSVADLVAEADALLAHRATVVEPLAVALAATVNSTAGPAADQAIAQAAAAVRLLELVRSDQVENPRAAGARYIASAVPDLEVAMLAGTDAGFKAAAVALLLAAAELANWTVAHPSADPSSAPLLAARALVEGARTHLLSNASAPSKAAAARLMQNGVLSARSVGDLDAEAAAQADAFLAALASGFEGVGSGPGGVEYATALWSLVQATLFLDRLDPVAEPEAQTGLAAVSAELSALLASNASREARAGAVSMAARLFEAVVAMGDRGLDLAVPQTNVSYESFSVALNENATILGLPSATGPERAAAATNLSLRTTAFLGNLINLNLTGIFTDQASFQRVLTMVTFLNETFAQLQAVMSLPDAASDLAHPAAMVGHEVLHVVNTTAPSPHHVDVNASAMFAAALRQLETAIQAGAPAAVSRSFEVAAAGALRYADFEAAGLMAQPQEALLTLTAASLETSAEVLGGGDPPLAKATFGAAAAGSFEGARVAPAGSATPEARSLLVPLLQEADGLAALLQAGQSPALFARFGQSSLSVFTAGLTQPASFVSGNETAQVWLMLDLMAPIPPLLASAAVNNATRDLFMFQVHVGAQILQAHLAALPPPPVPRDRTGAAARIHAAGDGGVARVLGVLLNTTANAPAASPSIPSTDLRFGPFAAAVAGYHGGLENELRAAFGYRARTLLPNAISSSGAGVAASGTVVIFLFNGSLDRPTLGAREGALRDLARAQGTGAVVYSAFGYGLMWYDTQAAMDLSVELFALTMLAVMGAALWAVYRNLFDVALTVALLGATVVWVLGTAALAGIVINPVTQVIPVLLIGLAEDYAVHITIGYRRKRAAGASPNRAVLASVVGIGGVLFVATVTNGLSFLSFGGANIALIRDFGTLMALGLAYSFALTLTLIPAATVLADGRRERRKAKEAEAAPSKSKQAPKSKEREHLSRSERALLYTVKKCTSHPASALAVVALLTAAAAIGATSLETTFSYDQITATDLEVVRTLNAVQDSYGASVQRVFIEVKGTVEAPAVFLAMAQTATRAADDPYVSTGAGLAGVVWIGSYIDDLALRMRIEGSAARGYSPAFADAFSAADTDHNGRLGAGDLLTNASLRAVLAAAAADPASTASELVQASAGGGFERAVMRIEVVRAVEHGDALTAALEEDAAPLRALGAGAGASEVTVTGLPLLNREVMQAVQDSGWQSVFATVILALIVLTVFFFAAFRSLALGPLTIAPTLIAVAWTLGAMVLAGLSLNMMTVMIATTTIGMGDLYAIHISHSFYRELRRHKDAGEAAAEMVREAGAPLLEASATTALGFLILIFAPVPVIQSYGLIFAASIVFAFLYSIIVMPILVLLLARATHKVGVELAV